MNYSVEVMERTLVPRLDWSEMGRSDHFVQLYETDGFLLDSVSGFIGTGLRAGEAGIVIATGAHRQGIAERLQMAGLDPAMLEASGRYVSLDAAETLATLMVDGVLDQGRVTEILGGVILRAGKGRPVRIFGEMVALLWAEGRYDAAVHLEKLWNELGKAHAFSLFCGYPIEGVGKEGLADPLREVCVEHAHVIPAESYTALNTLDDRLRAIALLQQKAHSVEVETAERRRAAERFRFLAELMPQKIFTACPDGDVDYVNRRWMDFTGLPFEEIRSWGWAQAIHPDDREETLRSWRHSLGSGETFQQEHRIRGAGRSYRWHLTSADAMRDADGSILIWVGSSTDIDEQKGREAALNRSIRHRDEFLSVISHDLRTPLTVVQGQAQILRRRAAQGSLDEETVLKGLEQIEDRSRMMVRLIGELLDVTQLRAGEGLQLDLRPVDLVPLVQESVAICRQMADGHELVVRTTEQAIVGEWDDHRLRRVVENLISNAIKYSLDGGTITISVGRESTPDGTWAVIQVADQGIGIPAQDLPHLFEWFYRGRNSSSGVAGSGLGLAGACQIVDQHGGSIDVESEEGAGSTFTVRLPLAI